MYRIIIAGSRDFTDYNLLKLNVGAFIFENCKLFQIEIVSGCAEGADRLGEKYAKEYNLPVKHFPANWNRYGKSAGYLRNGDMAQYADALIAFWDGESLDINSMIWVEFPDSLITALKNVNGVLYIFSSHTGGS